MTKFLYFKDAVLHYENNIEVLNLPKVTSEEEIISIEKKLGLKFPSAYREFLALMESNMSDLFTGSNCNINDLEENHSALVELFNENNVEYEVLNNCLVFYMHQGYIAFWFIINGEDDPICYGYSEGEEMKKEKELGKFSVYMSNVITEAIDNRIILLSQKRKPWWKFK